MATINGTNNADTLYGTASADSIYGWRGDDVLKGGGGADRLDGGGGYDTIFYGDSATGVTVNLATGRGYGGTAEGDTYVSIEAVRGSSYNDAITGRDDADELLYGLDGLDVLKGGGGADGLDGGSGDDILKGGGGADTLIGGSGSDTADYSQAPPGNAGIGVSVSLATGRGTFGEALDDVLIGIENLTGSAYTDYMAGDGAANVLRGLDGNDDLSGNGGNDVLEGGRGNDYLVGGAGADTMSGGADNDSYYVDNAADVVNEAAGEGSDLVWANVSYTLPAAADVETLYATGYDGVTTVNLTGNDLGQRIDGNTGNNVLSGLGGSDTLNGDEGFDQLFGGESPDLLVGGEGPDDLIGGAGGDLFTYRAVSQSGVGAGTFDVVHDFAVAAGDRFDFREMDADILTAGRQSWTFIGTAGFSAPGQVRYAADAADTYLQLNVDSDSTPESIIRIFGLHTVDAGWFML